MVSPSWAMKLNTTSSTNPSTLLQSSFVYSVKPPTFTLTPTSEDVVLESPLKFQAPPIQLYRPALKYNVAEEFAKSWQAEATEIRLPLSTSWSIVNRNSSSSSDFASTDEPTEIPESPSPLGIFIGGLGFLGMTFIKVILNY
ncbi:MAG: hypothetical protein AB4041_08620 [Microcystaceae cyanobacterium]